MFSFMLAAALAANPATVPVPPNPCKPAARCRYLGDVEVHDDKGVVSKRPVNAWTPFLKKDGTLLLFAGEMVTIRLDRRNRITVTAFTRPDRAPIDDQTRQAITNARTDALLKARPVESMKPGKNEILVFFGQVEHASRFLLKIENGYGAPLSYKAYLPNADGEYQRFPVCPVRPNNGRIEAWDYANDLIVLADFNPGGRAEQRADQSDCDSPHPEGAPGR